MSPDGPEDSAPHEGRNTARRSASTNAVLLAAMLLCAWVFLPLWKPLLLGTVFAAAVSGPHERLAARLWNRRYLSAALFTVLAATLILTPLTTIGAIALRQALAAADWVRKALESGGPRGILRPLPDNIERLLQGLIPKDLGTMPASSGEAGLWAALQMQNVVSTVSTFAFDLAMMMITFFFVLIDGRQLVGWLLDVSPLGRTRTAELLGEFRLVARSVIGSNVITGIVQAAVATVGYLVARAPQPLFFGLMTLLCSFIPSVGTALVTLPVAGLLLLTGHKWTALFLALWGLVLVSLVDNVLRPFLIKTEVQIHGAVIFFSLIGGIFLFGFPGLVVGPMALTFFLTMLRFHARDLKTPFR